MYAPATKFNIEQATTVNALMVRENKVALA